MTHVDEGRTLRMTRLHRRMIMTRACEMEEDGCELMTAKKRRTCKPEGVQDDDGMMTRARARTTGARSA